MAIQTDLSVAPYFDDYDITNNYYRVLFKPGVAVQVRELNQIQSIMANQVEQLAGQVYKNGTVISGTVFQFYPDYNYVKLKDTDNDGVSLRASELVDYYVSDSSNLIGIINNAVDGFESKDPDLNTVYVRYINAGDSKEQLSFTADSVLTVYQEDYPLESVTVLNGGLGFSNTDTVQIVPAIQVDVSTGSFTNGEIIVQEKESGFANLVIIGIESVNGGSDTQKVLRVRPIISDLSNTFITSSKWTLDPSISIRNSSNTAVATIDEIIGTGAKAVVTTDSAGTVDRISFTSKGEGYSVTPYITIRTATSVGVTNLELQARNFFKKVTVAEAGFNPVGKGYAFGVTEGIIYMNGTFVFVNPQVAVVSRYNNEPDNLVVGFTLEESIANSFTDSTLLDNALGTLNFTAPGADRLRIEPVLDVRARDTVQLDEEGFFTLCEFDEGKPTKQFRKTQFSGLEEAMAKRHDDITGDYVLDEFGAISKDKSIANNTHINMAIDAGVAYIKGREVATFYNTNLDVQRGTGTDERLEVTGSSNYGNYIKVTRVFGQPLFAEGEEVILKSLPLGTQTYSLLDDPISVTGAGSDGRIPFGKAVVLQGGGGVTDKKVGSAKVRSVLKVTDSNNPLVQEVNVYLYDIQIDSGFTFADVQGVAQYDGLTLTTVADAVLELNATLNANVASIQEAGRFNRLVFDTGYRGLKQANQISYIYMKQFANATYFANGTVILPTLSGNETYPFADGHLSRSQLDQIHVTADSDIRGPSHPTQSAINNVSGDWGIVRFNKAGLYTETGYTDGDFVPGELLEIANTAAGASATGVVAVPARIVAANATTVTFDISHADGTVPTLTANFDWARRRIASGQQISLAPNGRTATVSGGGTQLKIDAPLNPGSNTLALDSTTVTVTVPVQKNNVTPISKVVNRDVFVKLQMNTHPSGVSGPWSLGVPDGFRLKRVFKSSDIATVNTSSQDVTSSFMLDTGQRANFYGLSHLVKLPRGQATIGADDALLVQFDCFTSAEGVYTIDSYPINDTANLSSSTTTINTLEIPEFVDPQTKQYYDLRDCVDFRPRVSNTAVITQEQSLANINPSDVKSLVSGTKIYPKPNENYTYNAEYYLGHSDTIQLDEMGNFTVVKGRDATNKLSPPNPVEGTMKIATIVVPPYPSLPTVLSPRNVEFLEKRAGTGNQIVDFRRQVFTVSLPGDEVIQQFQPRRYTMDDIGKLERRVRNLEYYTSLSLLESNILNTPIASGVDPTINRFKNGYIVDDFSTINAAETTHPEFNAEIVTETTELEAPKIPLTINLKLNVFDEETNSTIINRHGFDEKGVLLTQPSPAANSELRSFASMLPYQNHKLIAVERRNSNTPKIVPKNQFGGILSVTPAVFDIATRVKNYKRQ